MTNHARVLVLERDIEQGADMARTLHASGYDGVVAGSAEEALSLAADHPPDIAIVATERQGWASLPARLVRPHENGRLPVILIGSDADDLVRYADTEFVPRRSLRDELMGRVDALARLATMRDELLRRDTTMRRYGIAAEDGQGVKPTAPDACMLLVGSGSSRLEALRQRFEVEAIVATAPDGLAANERLHRTPFDAVVVATQHPNDAMHFCESVRADSRYCSLPVFICADEASADVVAAPIGPTEIFDARMSDGAAAARILASVDRQRLREAMRARYGQARHQLTCDNLTGLYSHGFLHAHLETQVEDANRLGRPLSVGYLNVVEMRRINRDFGYATGDLILRQVGDAIGRLVRSEDLAARVDGANFVVALPDTPAEGAEIVLSRVASVIGWTAFSTPDLTDPVSLELQRGAAELEPDDSPDRLVKRARQNLTF